MATAWTAPQLAPDSVPRLQKRDRSGLRIAGDVRQEADPAHKQGIYREPGEQQHHYRRPAVLTRTGQNKDEVGRKYSADTCSHRQAPEARSEIQCTAQNKEQSRTECRSARGADESRFNDRIAKEALHQRAADTRGSPRPTRRELPSAVAVQGRYADLMLRQGYRERVIGARERCPIRKNRWHRI